MIYNNQINLGGIIYGKRRKKTKNFSVEIEKEKFEKLEEKLSQKGLTKTKWFNEKVDEEIGN